MHSRQNGIAPQSENSLHRRKRSLILSPTATSARMTNEVAQMLRDLGFDNLDALIDATVPKNIRLDRAARFAGRRKRSSEALAELRALASQESTCVRNFIGAGYSDCDHAAGHPAEHPRKSRLVHRLHAVSGRDRARTPRSAAQFSDDDHRSDRARYRQRFPPRRSDRRGRSDGALSCASSVAARTNIFCRG